MLYPQTENDWRTAMRRDWEGFLTKAAEFDGTEDSFHAVNSSLGYNLAKAVGPLVLDIERLELAASQRELLISTLYRKSVDQEKTIDKLSDQGTAQQKRIKDLEALDVTTGV
jgi:uncharacterized coiled-coil protein SlyX